MALKYVYINEYMKVIFIKNKPLLFSELQIFITVPI